MKDVPVDLLSRPFTVAEARASGVSLRMIRGRRFRRLFHGVYAARGLESSHALRLDAAALLLPDDAVFSHRTAARMLGVPVPRDGLVHATVPAGRGPLHAKGIRLHRAGADVPSIRVDGRRCTPPAQTFLDLAGAGLGLVDLVVAGDAMVRSGLVGLRGLLQVVDASPGRRGIASARRVAGLVRERVDSPMESRLRLLLVLAGLPCPLVNLEIRRPDGGFVCTPDLHYRESRVIIEYDGDVHRTEKAKWRRDHTVRRDLMDLGWKVLPFNAADYYGAPGGIVWSVHQALLSRGQPGTPTETSEEWTRHITPSRDEIWADEAE